MTNRSTHFRAGFGGIVLCGGKSTRMGQPKHLLPFGDETMLHRVVRTLSQVVSPIVVVAAAGQELPPLPKDILIARDEREALGPLEGLSAGLAALAGKAEAAYASSCDLPLLKVEFIARMIDELGTHDLVMPRDAQYHHPLAAVYRIHLVKHARALVSAGQMRPMFLLDRTNGKTVDVEELRDTDPDLDSLRNINTPEEYQRVLEKAGLAAQTRG
jgi:molybdopterin-guanine dinucleotide biosynthesis protein A